MTYRLHTQREFVYSSACPVCCKRRELTEADAHLNSLPIALLCCDNEVCREEYVSRLFYENSKKTSELPVVGFFTESGILLHEHMQITERS